MYPSEGVNVRVVDPFNNPVAGANLSLINQVTAYAMPLLTGVTNSNGWYNFPILQLVRNGVCDMLPAKNINIIAYVAGTSLGAMVSELTLYCGDLVTVKLKQYFQNPTFHIKYQFRDIIGSELFGQLVTSVQQWQLENEGYVVKEVKGEGTREVTIVYNAPYQVKSASAGPAALIIAWATLHPTATAIIAVCLALIVLLVVAKVVFGEQAGDIALGLIILGGLVAGSMILDKVGKREGKSGENG